MDYDFTGLTLTQERLLTFQGWQISAKTPRRPQLRVVNKLLERGLIVMQPLRVGGTDPKAYIVPIPVHMAWCEYCSSRKARYARA